jgi:hypothetical protein
MIVDIGDADGIDVMENAHLPGFVPPQLPETVETGDVFGIDAGGMGGGGLRGHG